MAAILISILSNSYYGMPREQIHNNWTPEHSIMSFETIEIKMAAVSAKRLTRSVVDIACRPHPSVLGSDPCTQAHKFAQLSSH